MEKEIYKIYTWDGGDYDIEKCKIVKETEKTYIIKDVHNRQYVIRKSQMQQNSYTFAVGYDEAVKKREETIKRVISHNAGKIEYFTRENERLNKLLIKE